MTDKLNPNISQLPFNSISPSQHPYPQLKPQHNSQQAQARESSISSASSLIPPSVSHPPKPIKKSSKISAIMMILSCISWVTGYIYSNDNNLHPIETSVLRGFLIMIVSFGLCAYMGIPLKVNKGEQGIVIKRNFIFWLQGFVMPAIQFYLPLGIIHTIGSTGSIFVCIFQYIFEKKKPHMRQGIGMCLTFTGIILTANGNMLTKWLNPDYQFITDFHNYHSNDPKSIAICSLLFTIFQCFWAYGVYSTNTMQSSPFVVNFLFSLKLYFTSSLLYPYILPLTGSQVSAPVFYQGLLWTGVLFAIAQTCFIISLSMAENIGITVMLSSFTIVVAYGASVWRYGEAINAFCLIGALMVMGGLWRILIS